MIDKEIARKYAKRWEFWSRSWCKSSSDGECFAADCPQTKNRQHTCPRPWLRDLSDSDYVPDPLSDDERSEFFNFVHSQIERSDGLDEMSIYCNIVDLVIYLGLPSDTVGRRLVAEAKRILIVEELRSLPHCSETVNRRHDLEVELYDAYRIDSEHENLTK